MTAPKRIQQRRTKGWRKPEGAVAVGRGTRWGNPARITEPERGEYVVSASDANGVLYRGPDPVEARRVAVDFFRRVRSHDDPNYLAELAGKDLMCWCPLDQPCHADVLLELANTPEGPS